MGILCECGLARISLYTMRGNVPSEKVAERAGFQREGLLRRWGEVNGEQLDWIMFSLIRADLESESVKATP